MSPRQSTVFSDKRSLNMKWANTSVVTVDVPIRLNTTNGAARPLYAIVSKVNSPNIPKSEQVQTANMDFLLQSILAMRPLPTTHTPNMKNATRHFEKAMSPGENPWIRSFAKMPDVLLKKAARRAKKIPVLV